MSQEPLPRGVRVAAVISLLGLAGIGYQTWLGMPGPAPRTDIEQLAIHPALQLSAPVPVVDSVEPDQPAPIAVSWQEQKMEGADEAGRSVFFRVMVLSPRYRWRLGSTSEFVKDDQGASLEELPDGRELAAQLASSRAILVLGSDEETRDGPVLSTGRAQNLARWLRHSLTADAPVLAVDAGRYRGTATAPEAQTRRFVVAAVSVLDPGADLTAALRDALATNEQAPINVRLYSGFERLSDDESSRLSSSEAAPDVTHTSNPRN